MSATSTTSLTSPLPLDALPDVSELARGLATGTPDVTPFLPDRPDLGTIEARTSLVLSRFGKRLPPSADPAHLDLVTGRYAGIFAGQQVGLFTGPLLTIVKALAAVKLSRDLAARGLPVAPGFWCASEDHDLVEVTRLVLPEDGRIVDVGPDPGSLADNRRPVGNLPIGFDVEALLGKAAATLTQPPDEAALQELRDRNAGKTFRDGFQSTLSWILDEPAMRVVDEARAGDKPDLVPLAARLVRERSDVRRILLERDEALVASGFPLQVTQDAHALPLFAIVNGERFVLKESGARLELKGHPEELSYEAEVVVERFASGEWLPSFAALSRPLSASVLYPIAATILGPAEIAYWAQSYPLFAWAGIVPPVIVPRPMVSLLEAPIRRLMEKLELSLADVLAGADAILRARGERSAGHVLKRLEGAKARALEELDAVGVSLVALDANLAKPLETTKEKLRFTFEKLEERAVTASGRADEQAARQVARVVTALAPEGRLAERLYTPVTTLLKHGREAVVSRLAEALRWDQAGLQVIEL